MAEWNICPDHFSNKFEIDANENWINLRCYRSSGEVGHIQYHAIKSPGARELAMALLAAADKMDRLLLEKEQEKK